MLIAITTTDQAFAGQYPADKKGRVLVPVSDSSVERLTFAGQDMIRFDLQTAAGRLPQGWANRWTMLPATRIAGR